MSTNNSNPDREQDATAKSQPKTRDERVAANVAGLAESAAKKMLAAMLNEEDLFAKDRNKRTVLGRALERGDEKLAAFLVQQEPRLLMEEAGETRAWPMEMAASLGMRDLCKSFLAVVTEQKEHLATQNNPERWMGIVNWPLEAAIKRGDKALTELFLPFFNSSAGDNKLWRHNQPLGQALNASQWTIFHLILEHSSAEQINFCDTEGGRTIAHGLLATIGSENEKDSDRREAKRAFFALAARSDWDAENIVAPAKIGIEGPSILLAAIDAGDEDIVKMLIPKADMSVVRQVPERSRWARGGARDAEAHTPLSFASAHRWPLFDLLFDASKDCLDARGIERSGSWGKLSVLELLIKMEDWGNVAKVARELIEQGKMSLDEQKELENALWGKRMPDPWKNHKEQFLAAREAFEIKSAIANANAGVGVGVGKQAVAAGGLAEGESPETMKPKTMRL